MEYMHNKKIRLAHEFADKAEAEWMLTEQGKQAHAEGWHPRACRYINEVNFAIGMFYYEESNSPVMAIPTPLYLHDGDAEFKDRRYSFMEFAKEYGKMGKSSRRIPTRLTEYWKSCCKFNLKSKEEADAAAS